MKNKPFKVISLLEKAEMIAGNYPEVPDDWQCAMITVIDLRALLAEMRQMQRKLRARR